MAEYQWYNPLGSPFASIVSILPAAPIYDVPENARVLFAPRLMVHIMNNGKFRVRGFFEKPSNGDTTIRLRNVFRDDPAPSLDEHTFRSIAPIFHVAANANIEIRFTALKKDKAPHKRDLMLVIDSGATYEIDEGLFHRVFVLLMGAESPSVKITSAARIATALHVFTVSGVRNASIAIDDYTRTCAAPMRVCGAITAETAQKGWSAGDVLPIQTYTDTGRAEAAAGVGSAMRIARFASIESLGEFFDTHASLAHEIVRPPRGFDFESAVSAVRAQQQALVARDLVIPFNEQVPVNAARMYKSLHVAPAAADLLS